MISFIRGKILNKRKNFVIVDCHDIGYQVFVNPVVHAELELGQSIEFYTHHHIKEDALDLYGFNNLEELELFELLLSISGVGPRSALGIMAASSVNELKESIARGDSSSLTKVSGIGKKTAERIVLELRDKMDVLTSSEISTSGENSASSDEIDALISLGYSLQQAREALREVNPLLKNSGERIREALRKMGR
ncbi:MAG: Holliday junction DNA helicase, subunit A [Candidatus Falkowbacteria bacterium GW2011_GWF2_39_8]|uniref:Holliday junction branch migration complex subunit RuvA n=1 Tax=Candidatus Falkowbacteria bacterium GW2011_GWF2_39_8 TaxID=1618642 RepID=A0A0G0PW11_9BACT|nr:MAG: Holliday junction DNA helicase, subunit A [Candidatus Falkowbacteria bacterium GW2011_GWF2_39_8]